MVKIVRELPFLVLILLLAGTVSGLTYLFLANTLNLKLSKVFVSWSSASVGVSVALGVEGALKKERPKDVLLRRVIPAVVGMSIAYSILALMGGIN